MTMTEIVTQFCQLEPSSPSTKDMQEVHKACLHWRFLSIVFVRRFCHRYQLYLNH